MKGGPRDQVQIRRAFPEDALAGSLDLDEGVVLASIGVAGWLAG